MSPALGLNQAERESRRESAAFATLFVVVAAYLAVRFGPAWYLEKAALVPGDFNVYWTAAERLSSAANIYVPTDPSPYKYSPSFALLFRATVFVFDKRLAAAGWMAASALAYLGAVFFLARKLIEACGWRRQLMLAFGLGIFLSWHGLLETLSYGQIDLLLGSALVWLIYASLPGRNPEFGSRLSRAALWASVLIVKPHLVIVLLPACLALGWREGLRALLATLATYFASFLALGFGPGWRMHVQWLECLRVQQDAAFMTANINQSLAAVLARTMGHSDLVGPIEVVMLGGYLACLFYLAWRIRGSRASPSAGAADPVLLALWGVGLSGYLLFSPLSWRWCVFWWAPLAGLLVRVSANLRSLAPWAVLAVFAERKVHAPLGLDQGDLISFWGFYMLATAALFFGFFRAAHGSGAPSPSRS